MSNWGKVGGKVVKDGADEADRLNGIDGKNLRGMKVVHSKIQGPVLALVLYLLGLVDALATNSFSQRKLY